MSTVLRLLLAWASTAVWLFVLGKLTHVAPVGIGGSLMLGLLLMPAIYFPIAALFSGGADGNVVSAVLMAPIAIGGMAFSMLVLGVVGFMGMWGGEKTDESKISLLFTVFLLHVLVIFSVKVLGNLWIPNDDDE
jgi:heme/copper-type cytochrome/quinol oxidase subunit 4